MKILMILTSHDRLGDSGDRTGFWLEEFAAPYYAFRDAGAEVMLASPRGGQPPLDPKSDAPEAQTEATRRFRTDADARRDLASTRRLADLSADDFDALFYPGGHGPMWDLAGSRESVAMIEAMLGAGKPVAAVCHAPAVLRDVMGPDQMPLLRGRRVTGFANSEEEAVGLSQIVPFRVEDMVRSRGGLYSKAADWQPHVVTEGLLVTGQNPASSLGAAQALLELVRTGTGERLERSSGSRRRASA
jgi:putative intracellular protease/amidase